MNKAIIILLATLGFSLGSKAQGTDSMIYYVDTNLQVHKIDTITDKDTIYYSADVMPQYPGGVAEMDKFLDCNVRTPPQIKEACVERISLVIRKDGSIAYVKPIEDCGYGCFMECISVIKKMPKWSPGLIDGKPVAVRIVINVKFKPF